jgi:hypothetical protein
MLEDQSSRKKQNEMTEAQKTKSKTAITKTRKTESTKKNEVSKTPEISRMNDRVTGN